ncbi:Glucose-inhibited division protein A [Limihaloglobus sulfuriphilus]|uniref:tRNA uridine 5-carboxymethylaminomethyl modification enzyme MnmG n=1 Tax=Limihaloglobus sulfuriphilus TaxID=1851148 RepID=A0A1R7T668_9BACT|nr:tRNA uridine-5-carboxymethylaminomethyl(34) synthesis enzyme MnmG [Limihaloglobus sulfuriphilus]AQQ72406.1 Glucose-inhibited division protein A [Limihaloglobus sulfuriphilus]
MPDKQHYECIVIGGGHAGAEAADAAARMGAQTLLITMKFENICEMSCNPSIGGLGKGQITREIDALGGLMARAIDASGLQFRLLNRSKGPAVQSPRAQADKIKYKQTIQSYLADRKNLTIAEGIASEILTENSKVIGVKTLDGRVFRGETAVITAGTFLRGVMHIGTEQIAGGRRGEPASNELSDCLRKLGLTVERLKTGTPVRVDTKTVNFSRTQIQPGDEKPVPFSFMNDSIDTEQIPCWITFTNPDVHKLLRDNLERAPLYTGQIGSTGPRYCPSIETKIVRFPEKDKHQIFLEPEDRSQATIYPNGISTSVPKDVQEKMLSLIPGLENARIVHYGYAIEYDYCPAETQLKINLETKKIDGLFLAGQVNGTSGYEEAAALGLMAGVNAVLKTRGSEPFTLGRHQAYIGVMIDDLLTRHLVEPYRMFTSRAEYRLSLRADNADRRLTGLGIELGLVEKAREKRFTEKIQTIAEIENWLKHTRRGGSSLWQLLRQHQHPLGENLADEDFIKELAPRPEILESVLIDARYQGYLKKQQKLIDSFRNIENIKIPPAFDYYNVSHLRYEAKERLTEIKPDNLGQAGRIGGITPADITVIQIHLKKQRAAAQRQR